MSAPQAFRLITLAALLAAAGCAGQSPTDDAANSGTANPGSRSSTAVSAPTGDAERGRELFNSNACATCHGVTAGDTSKVGPTLFGVMGRQAGTAKSLMGPSENMKKYGVTWTVETLDEFLMNPNAKVPGTAMVGMLTDPQQRADVIAYLATLK